MFRGFLCGYRHPLPSPLCAVLFKAAGAGEGLPSQEDALGNAGVDDLIDFPDLPLFGMVSFK